MENPICISTGLLYRLMKDRNEIISKIKESSPAGIELSFVYPQNLFDFEINQENLKYLQSLKFNSIHAPWKEIVYGNNQKSKDTLKAIEKLYKQIKGRNVIFHKGRIEDYDLILSHDFTASIENGDWRKSKNSIEDIKSVLNKNKKFKFTFDFAHAITISSLDIPEYVNYFKDKLVEIHVSIVNKELERHDFLYKCNSAEIRKLLQNLKTVNVNIPIVLECIAINENEIQLIKKEMKYIKAI